MRRIIQFLVVLLLTLSGCSHSYVKRWGNGEIVACCPTQKWACSEDKLQELAIQKCGGQPGYRNKR